jgi:hypothetical protein
MLGARRLLLLGPFALLAFVGLACAPTTRDFGSTGGQGGGASTSGPCAAGTLEDCFNGLDDDCNGKADCEDPACSDAAVCEPAALAASSGVVVGEGEACPEGFTADEQLIHRKLQDTGCAGCDCKLFAPTCTADVWYYDASSTCASDTTLKGGISAGNFGTTCSSPINAGNSNSYVLGVRTGLWKMEQSCSPDGAATPAAPAWGETMKFCRANAEGKGCSAGNTCVPKTAAAPHCALATGTSTCNGFGTAESDWYTGFSDTRACGACECQASGGSCDDLLLAVGSDYSCSATHNLKQGTKECFSGTGVYSPPVQLAGKAAVGKCDTSAKVTGNLAPTGQLTLCCQP